jgi:D-arginine dehydrogenase
MTDPIDADVIVIGAGIAGASIAYFLAPQLRVLILEREAQAGMHSTGRSAALFSETYGSAQVRALTRASRRFLDNPPAGFTQHPLLSPRGSLIVSGAAQVSRMQALHDMFRSHTDVQWLDVAQVHARVPVLRPESAGIGLLEPGAADIDVHELHQGFLRGLRAQDGRLRLNVGIRAIERDTTGWTLDCGEHRYRAPLLVNAAGAWVDQVALMAGVAPIGIEPRRRSAFTFAPPAGVVTTHWPFVTDIDERFYFKPDAGQLLGSPANADPVAPHDVQPEEWDIALGIHHIEAATTMSIRRPTRSWAGLRSFVADGDLVGGFSVDANGFFWLAAQGGYGIQTCAAMGEACAHLARGDALPAWLVDAGVSDSMLRPRRHPASDRCFDPDHEARSRQAVSAGAQALPATTMTSRLGERS